MSTAQIQFDIPPGMSPQRMIEIYSEPFRRIIEYTRFCNIKGDIAEFGTYRGLTASIFAKILREYSDKRKMYLFDSWEGFPKPSGGDANCREVLEGHWKEGDCRVEENTLPNLRSILQQVIPNQAEFIKGFYQDTLINSTNLPQSISVLHIDCDLYESTKTVLQTTAPLLSNGAVVLFDDFNNNEAANNFGERRAFLETIATKCEIWFTYGWSGYAFIYHKN
jgi:hypothetical protein